MELSAEDNHNSCLSLGQGICGWEEAVGAADEGEIDSLAKWPRGEGAEE